jgi:isopentenyldiphosphate isomerase/intracellular septation protein A
MNKIDLLKSMAPGFLPLIIFILADSIWGTKIGLVVAVAVGILEMVISYAKEKVVDKFVLMDIGLIVALGVVSIVLDNPIFFKLKPALIELVICVLLAVSIFSPMNIMLMMSQRYMKNIELNEAQIDQMNKSLRAMFFIFLAHTALITYSAFFMSKGAWAFISGGLFYIMFVAYFGIEFFRKKVNQKKWIDKYKDEEWLDIVDEQGKITGSAPRSVCHSGPGMLHPVVHLHVVDSKDRIFLQKRSLSKLIQPGKWDTSVGGHLSRGEKIEDGLKRESLEELNLTEFNAQFISQYVWESEKESELVFMFLTRCDKTITINRDEIDEGKYWKIKKIKDNLGEGIFNSQF